MSSPAYEAWVEAAREGSILDAAVKAGAQLKRQGGEHVGPCPSCGGADRFSINPKKRVFNCRGADGGDVIAMVQHLKGLSFLEACEWLNGTPPPGRDKSGKVEAAAIAPAPAKDAAALETEDNAYRAKQIRIARGIWDRGLPIAGTPAEDYLKARGITAIPVGAPLRFSAAQAYYHDADFSKDEPKPLHVGPAMLAAMTDPEGEIVGCHITWLNPDVPGQKLALYDGKDPPALLPAKKMRGTKRRAAIKLDPGPLQEFLCTRLVIGEGIETVLSVWYGELGRDIPPTAYWSALDLGHLAGKARATIPHPTKKVAGGTRPLMVGNDDPEPQPERDLMPPDSVTEIVLLGDGDSDRFATELALKRAARRWARPGRAILIAWAPEGADFNDLLRGT